MAEPAYNPGPFRKVETVKFGAISGIRKEVLECGHFGATLNFRDKVAKRRRCRDCGKAKAVQP